MIRILIVDDNAVVRNGLKTLLSDEPDLDAILDAADGRSALALLEADPLIDIVLADFNMPEMDGVELTRKIRAKSYAAKVIILTMHRQVTFRDKALAAGARGYLLKGEHEEILFAGIRSVYSGEVFISPGFPV